MALVLFVWLIVGGGAINGDSQPDGLTCSCERPHSLM